MPEINGARTDDPYEIPAELQSAVNKWNLSKNIQQIVDEGYTVLRDDVSVDLTD